MWLPRGLLDSQKLGKLFFQFFQGFLSEDNGWAARIQVASTRLCPESGGSRLFLIANSFECAVLRRALTDEGRKFYFSNNRIGRIKFSFAR
jgi:hypothetical protein